MMIHPIIRPALPMVVLIVIGGWMLAGLAEDRSTGPATSPGI